MNKLKARFIVKGPMLKLKLKIKLKLKNANVKSFI